MSTLAAIADSTVDGVRTEALFGPVRHVPLRDGRSVCPINLDHAASTPPLQAVRETVENLLDWYSSVHRGTGFGSQLCTHAYEEARAAVGAFVGARPGQHSVIFGANTTWALNKLAKRLTFQPGQVVITTELEHHANDLPWRQVAQVVYARCDQRGDLDLAHLKSLLAQHAGRVRLVAVTGGSNVTGAIPPIHRIAELAHAAGAEIAVDAAQLAPHRPIDIGDLSDPAHIDYLAFSGHKLYAPFGGGALVGRSDTFADGIPDAVGGGVVRRVTTDAVEWTDGPARDEAGTPNLVGAVSLAAATVELRRLGLERLAAHEAELTALALRRLREIPCVQIYGNDDPAQAEERLGVIPFAVENVDYRLVAAILSWEYGIAVRAGAFCAHPYVGKLLDSADASCGGERQNGLIRASLGLATTAEDIETLAEALRAIADGVHLENYVFDPAEGAFVPRQTERPHVREFFQLRH
jgi:cysteine desulfurase/selenocysteine lyase